MPRLYLIPIPLGNINKDAAPSCSPKLGELSVLLTEECVPNSQPPIFNSLRHFIVENIRTARRALRLMGYTASFDDTVFYELNEHTPDEALASFLQPLAEGHDMGLMSEAGVPCIADPGARIVSLAHQLVRQAHHKSTGSAHSSPLQQSSTGFAHSSPKLGREMPVAFRAESCAKQRGGGVCPPQSSTLPHSGLDPESQFSIFNSQFSIEIVPLVGPCSIILALMASGFNGQNFAFLGYLPFDARQRQEALARIEQAIFRHNQTQILIETPYRNNRLLAELATKMPPETLICVATDLTLPTQSIRVLPARQWLQPKVGDRQWSQFPPDLNHHYCVFLLYK